MADNDTPGQGHFKPHGAWLAVVIKELPKHCYTQNTKTLGPWFQRRRFLYFAYYKSMGANDPLGMANLGPGT